MQVGIRSKHRFGSYTCICKGLFYPSPFNQISQTSKTNGESLQDFHIPESLGVQKRAKSEETPSSSITGAQKKQERKKAGFSSLGPKRNRNGRKLVFPSLLQSPEPRTLLYIYDFISQCSIILSHFK